jgi:hypothetical protein
VDLTSAGSSDGYIVKLDGAGGYQWAKQLGGISYDAPAAIGINRAGTIGVAGRYTGPATFGSLVLPSAGSVSMFVSQLRAPAGNRTTASAQLLASGSTTTTLSSGSTTGTGAGSALTSAAPRPDAIVPAPGPLSAFTDPGLLPSSLAAPGTNPGSPLKQFARRRGLIP